MPLNSPRPHHQAAGKGPSRFLILLLVSGLSPLPSWAAEASKREEAKSSRPAPESEREPSPFLGPFPVPDRVGFGGRFSEFNFTSRHVLRKIRTFRTREYLILGSIALGAILLADDKAGLQEEFQENRDKEKDNFFLQFKQLGDAGTVPALGASFFLFGKIFQRPRVEDTGFVLLESALLTGVATQIGQFILSEDRPEAGGKMRFFRPGGHGVSGHAAIAASISGPLNRQFLTIRPEDNRKKKAWKYVGKVFVYGVPALTGLSRINEDRHYAWNVALGLALGYTMGNTVANAHAEFTGERPSRLRPSAVRPYLSENGESGVLVGWKF